MRSIADANVLFPLLCDGHVARQAAMEWFDRQPVSSVGWCLLTKLAILRHLTNRRIMGEDVQSPASALKAWDLLENDERLEEADPPPASHEGLFRSFVTRREPDPNRWTDAWLAALAETSEREMVTFDRGFLDFPITRLRILRAQP